jgi:Ca-activated chloride channel family protein
VKQSSALLARVMAIGMASMEAVLAEAPQPQTFRAGVELVKLDVSVLRGGQPVRGLTKADFLIDDSGVRQSVDSVTEGQDLPVNVVMALDVSGSVSGDKLANLVDAGRQLNASLRPDDRAALITFSSVVQVRVPLTSDRTEVADALTSLRGEGPTAVRDAVWAALQLKPDDDSRTMVLVFTDGVDNASFLGPSELIPGARRMGTVVHAVELGPALSQSPARSFLGVLADVTGGRQWNATSSRDLHTLFTTAIDEMRARYLVTFYPNGVRHGGWHELKVGVRGRGEVKTRPGYFVGPVE